MAVSSSSSSWFQSWTPSDPVYPAGTGINFRHEIFDHAPPINGRFGRVDDKQKKPGKHYGKSTSTIADYIPYLITLGMTKPPPEHPNFQPSTSFHPNTNSNFDPSNNFHPSNNFQQSHPKTFDRRLQDLETTGPFATWYSWKQLDFAYRSDFERERAIFNEEFVQENNLPLGIEVYKDRIFISMPKWKKGVPVTLATLPRVPQERSPKLVPYPSWDWQSTGDCDGLVSVYRMEADECGRLWVMDSGQIEVTIKPQQVCPPQLFVFDLKTDALLLRYPLPEKFIKQDSLYSNIRVDIRDHQCEDAHAYIADVWRFGIVVFSLKEMNSWRVTDHLFYPDPLAAAYTVHGLNFEWTDGIFGMALSPTNRINDRILYFHPMSSFREFYVKTSVIRNETGWDEVKDAFKVLGQSRGKSGHASASAMDRNGILFYNQVTRDSIACWDSRKPYKRGNLGLVAYSNETIVFPNDLKIDKEKRQSVWILSNKLPIYLYKGLDSNEINFRIMSAYTDDAVRNTLCDPNVFYSDSYHPFHSDEDCY